MTQVFTNILFLEHYVSPPQFSIPKKRDFYGPCILWNAILGLLPVSIFLFLDFWVFWTFPKQKAFYWKQKRYVSFRTTEKNFWKKFISTNGFQTMFVCVCSYLCVRERREEIKPNVCFLLCLIRAHKVWNVLWKMVTCTKMLTAGQEDGSAWISDI